MNRNYASFYFCYEWELTFTLFFISNKYNGTTLKQWENNYKVNELSCNLSFLLEYFPFYNILPMHIMTLNILHALTFCCHPGKVILQILIQLWASVVALLGQLSLP